MDGYSPIHPFMKNKPYKEADSWLFEDNHWTGAIDRLVKEVSLFDQDQDEDKAVDECLEADVVVVGNGYLIRTQHGNEYVAESKESLRVILKEVLAAKGLTRKVEEGLG